MDLIDCAGFFDDTVVTLPGSTVPLFMGELVLNAGQMRDGLQTERRLLKYDPRQVFTPPLDGIVSFAGRNWVLGLPSPDEFQSDEIRSAYIVQLADSTFQIGAAADWIGGTPRASGYGGLVWEKDLKNDTGTEEVWSQVTVYTGAGFDALEGEFIKVAGTLYRLQNVHITPSGMAALQAVELPSDALQAITYASAAAFDRVANKPVPGVPLDVPALVMRYYQQSRVVTQAQVKAKDGDLVARVRTADCPLLAAGDTFTVNGVSFKVAAKRVHLDGTWWAHLTT